MGCSQRVQDHSVLAEPSTRESIVYAGTWMPFPMKPLELVLSVRWADLVPVRTWHYAMSASLVSTVVVFEQ